VLVALLDVAGCRQDLEGWLHSSMPTRAPGRADRRDVREGRDFCSHLRSAGTVRVRGLQTGQAWYTTALILLQDLGVGLLETGNRLSGMPLPQAMLRASLATWLGSVRDGCDGMRECQLDAIRAGVVRHDRLHPVYEL
jgi:hypothetical protein